MALRSLAGSVGTPEKGSLVQAVSSVDVDGSCIWDRYTVRVNGIDVPLTGKSFKYFARLAWSRKKEGKGWVWKEDLEPGWNQARYIYRMKGEIAEVIGSSWPVVENRRDGHYRLAAEPNIIKLNAENLRTYPDIEISRLFLQP